MLDCAWYERNYSLIQESKASSIVGLSHGDIKQFEALVAKVES